MRSRRSTSGTGSRTFPSSAFRTRAAATRAALVQAWHGAIQRLRGEVTPDPDGHADGPNYGSSFKEADYAAIPKRDLPFGVPDFLGDDAAGRQGHPRHNNSVSRPTPDDGHTLIWNAPDD